MGRGELWLYNGSQSLLQWDLIFPNGFKSSDILKCCDIPTTKQMEECPLCPVYVILGFGFFGFFLTINVLFSPEMHYQPTDNSQYFSYCQQSPWKDQNQQGIDLTSVACPAIKNHNWKIIP